MSDRSIVALRVVKEAICIFGAKELLQAMKWAHPKYAVSLEKECKQALLEEEERKKSEQAKEAQRAAEKAKNFLNEQLKEREVRRKSLAGARCRQRINFRSF